MNTNKHQIRQHMRAARRSLSQEQQQRAADQVCEQVIHINRYRFSQNVGFYLSFDSELDPTSLLLHAHQTGKKCYLPALHPRQIGMLSFFPYVPGDPLIPNRFGILEPALAHEQQPHPSWQLDIVFTPLVAFDKHKNRLGMGKGYYDRTFAFLNTLTSAHKPYLIGLAYQMQQVPQLTIEAHDVRLEMIVTEAKSFHHDDDNALFSK